jgi:PAS domain S-box-containing protein
MALPGDIDLPMQKLARDGLLQETAEDLYENAPVAYFSSLVDGTLVRVNATLLRWTGYERDELLGRKRFHDLLPSGARIYYETHYAPLLQMQGFVREIAVELVRADGTRLPVLMNSTLVRDGAGAARIVRTTAFDASDRRRYERELLSARADAESRARAAIALAHVAEGVLLVGEDGDLQLMNFAAEAIFGVTSTSVVGKPAIQVLEGWADVASRLAVDRPGESEAREVVPVRRGGSELWLSVAAAHAGGATVYTVRDVTGERRLDQIRSDVIAIVSHELRTPLTGAFGAAQTLSARYDDLTDATKRELLQMIVEQSDRLSKILDQILLANQIDTDNLDRTLHSFDATEVIDSVVRAMSAGARRRIVVEGKEGITIEADLDRLRQVVANLVDNALKYSSGAVRIDVAKRDLLARITVSDDGPGIPFADRDRVFEKFFRLDPAQRSGVGGTGLGLYIAHELVQRMRGRIGLLPRERGATFFVDVPLANEPKNAFA